MKWIKSFRFSSFQAFFSRKKQVLKRREQKYQLLCFYYEMLVYRLLKELINVNNWRVLFENLCHIYRLSNSSHMHKSQQSWNVVWDKNFVCSCSALMIFFVKASCNFLCWIIFLFSSFIIVEHKICVTVNTYICRLEPHRENYFIIYYKCWVAELTITNLYIF